MHLQSFLAFFSPFSSLTSSLLQLAKPTTFCKEAPLYLWKMIQTTSPPQTDHSLVVSMGRGEMLTGFQYGSQILRKELWFGWPIVTDLSMAGAPGFHCGEMAS